MSDEVMHLIVNAGNHDREYCPAYVDIESSNMPTDMPVVLYPVDAKGKYGIAIPGQSEAASAKTRVHFVIDRLLRGQNRNYELRIGQHAVAVLGACRMVQLEDHAGARIDVKIQGERFTSYCYSKTQVRPFLHPVMGPYGHPLTRELEGDKAQGFDHPHHRSIYVAHGDVNGSDNWSEEKGHGWIRHRAFEALRDGPVFAEIVAHNEWTDKDDRKILEQTTRLRFYNLPRATRIIDKELTFRFTEGDVKFGDTKEGGILSIRVYPTMTGSSGGQMTNAYGARSESEIWGKRAHWLDYSGPVGGGEGGWCGIAMFDTPGNFRYPTYWHARDYGLATANPFGLSDFFGSKEVDGSHTFSAGSTAILRYRLLLHAGDCEAARVAERFHDYVSPAYATIVDRQRHEDEGRDK